MDTNHGLCDGIMTSIGLSYRNAGSTPVATLPVSAQVRDPRRGERAAG
jgi:hypothetical protein